MMPGCGCCQSRDWTRFYLYYSSRIAGGVPTSDSLYGRRNALRVNMEKRLYWWVNQYSGDIVKALAAGGRNAVMRLDQCLLEQMKHQVKLKKFSKDVSLKLLPCYGISTAMKKGSAVTSSLWPMKQTNSFREGIEVVCCCSGAAADIVFQMLGGIRSGTWSCTLWYANLKKYTTTLNLSKCQVLWSQKKILISPCTSHNGRKLLYVRNKRTLNFQEFFLLQ